MSINQLESAAPGCIAQLKVALTTQQFKYSAVFIDQFSGLSYVFLQKCITSEKTVSTKKAFEHFVSQRGIKIAHYHADNGQFADHGFINHCPQSGQVISYCSINAHFQNGVAECKIATSKSTHEQLSSTHAMNGQAW